MTDRTSPCKLKEGDRVFPTSYGSAEAKLAKVQALINERTTESGMVRDVQLDQWNIPGGAANVLIKELRKALQ
jgi:hypothetical protein